MKDRPDPDDITTLRHAQRLAAKTQIGKPIRILGYYRQATQPLSTIDQLITAFGPNYHVTWRHLADALRYRDSVSHLRRLKHTNETAPTSPSPSETADKHGGDGNSAEVTHPETTRSAADQDPTATTGDLEEAPEEARPRTDGGAMQPDPDRIEASEREANPPDAIPPATLDDPALGPTAASNEATGDASASQHHPAGAEGSLNRAPFPTHKHGGYYGRDPIPITAPEARKIYRLLSRLVRQHDLTTEGDAPSNRYSPRQLIRERTTRRWNLARSRKPQPNNKIILLICDCSGSCSAVCRATLGACLEIARRHTPAYTLITSNSWVNDTNQTITQWLKAAKLDPGLIVVFGDWDAGDEYAALVAAGADLIWFDSYASRHGPRPASRHLRHPAASWPKQPLAWYQGINSAQTTIRALQHLLGTN